MKRNLLLVLMLLAAITTGFSQITSVALVGPAVDGDWPGTPANPGPTDPHQLTQIDADHWQITDVTLTAADCKLRANNAWGVAGGEWAGTFPSAVGTSAGNIAVPVGGVYTVTLNTTTNVYEFISGGAPLAVVKLFGSSVDPATGVTMTPTSATTYKLTDITLLDGTAQFDIDGNAFGGDTFPDGAAFDPALFIPVAAGTYSLVTFDTSDGSYHFTAAPVYHVISVTGTGIAGGAFGTDTDLETTDGITYKLENLLLIDTPSPASDNGIKFRQDNDWAVNWGGDSFYTGTAVVGGANIQTIAGDYRALFNLQTLEYSFSFPSIALVGPAAGGWPDSANPMPDVNVLTTTDGMNYTINGLVIVDGEAKFRQNNDWDQPSFGDTTSSNGNIFLTAGTYNVTFNRMTGAFTFTNALATKSFNASNFSVSPNPTHNNWNFSAVNGSIESISIIDVLGKTVMTVNPKNNNANVDASALNSGVYFARISTANANTTVKLVKN